MTTYQVRRVDLTPNIKDVNILYVTSDYGDAYRFYKNALMWQTRLQVTKLFNVVLQTIHSEHTL